MSSSARLVRWLPTPSTAPPEDFHRFGPNAVQVRTLLEFLPTLSQDATELVYDIFMRVTEPPGSYNDWELAFSSADHAVQDTDRHGQFWAAVDAVDEATYGDLTEVGRMAMRGEVASDLIDGETYELLTDILNIGRVYDQLMRKPRYRDVPLLDVVQWFFDNFYLVRPYQLLAAGRVAQCPEDVREIAFTLIKDGMIPSEAIAAARRL